MANGAVRQKGPGSGPQIGLISDAGGQVQPVTRVQTAINVDRFRPTAKTAATVQVRITTASALLAAAVGGKYPGGSGRAGADVQSMGMDDGRQGAGF